MTQVYHKQASFPLAACFCLIGRSQYNIIILAKGLGKGRSMRRYIANCKRRCLKIIIGEGFILTSSLVRTLVSLTQQRFQSHKTEIMACPAGVVASGPDAIRIPVQSKKEDKPQANHAPQIAHCPASETDAAYLGSETSDKFHRLTCRYAQTIAAENRLCFASREAAINHGYVPCGICKP